MALTILRTARLSAALAEISTLASVVCLPSENWWSFRSFPRHDLGMPVRLGGKYLKAFRLRIGPDDATFGMGRSSSLSRHVEWIDANSFNFFLPVVDFNFRSSLDNNTRVSGESGSSCSPVCCSGLLFCKGPGLGGVDRKLVGV